jgi:hypothetical protein
MVKLWLIDGDKYVNGGLENITTIILSSLFFTKLHKKRIISSYKVEAGLLWINERGTNEATRVGIFAESNL